MARLTNKLEINLNKEQDSQLLSLQSKLQSKSKEDAIAWMIQVMHNLTSLPDTDGKLYVKTKQHMEYNIAWKK